MQRDILPFPALTGRRINTIKTHNLRAVLLALLRQGGMSRARLADLTGLSATTITNLVAEMLEQGLVTEAGIEPPDPRRRTIVKSTAGRPPTLLKLIPSARYAVGLHIGVETLRVGVADLFGHLCNYLVFPHPTGVRPDDVLVAAVRMVEQALREAQISRDCLVGLGVGASGLVDVEAGVNVLAPNLGWRDIPIRERLAAALGMPVFVDNNVRAMALAEAMFGAGRGVNTLAFIYGRVGVGAGFVVGGQIYRGSHAGAGEIGHMTMIPAGGAPCRCGNTGCLETLVSEQEIVRQAQVIAGRAPDSVLAAALLDDGRRMTDDGPWSSVVGQAEAADTPIERIFAAARAGDRGVLALLSERAAYMGTALANLVNLISPEMIILGGLFAAGADLLLPTVEETMRRRSFAGLGESVQVCITSFGRQVGVVGAAALALETFFYRQEA
jgi:glucokinase-like ROK family protein